MRGPIRGQGSAVSPALRMELTLDGALNPKRLPEDAYQPPFLIAHSQSSEHASRQWPEIHPLGSLLGSFPLAARQPPDPGTLDSETRSIPPGLSWLSWRPPSRLALLPCTTSVRASSLSGAGWLQPRLRWPTDPLPGLGRHIFGAAHWRMPVQDLFVVLSRFSKPGLCLLKRTRS